jgi:hypothetical protein
MAFSEMHGSYWIGSLAHIMLQDWSGDIAMSVIKLDFSICKVIRPSLHRAQ